MAGKNNRQYRKSGWNVGSDGWQQAGPTPELKAAGKIASKAAYNLAVFGSTGGKGGGGGAGGKGGGGGNGGKGSGAGGKGGGKDGNGKGKRAGGQYVVWFNADCKGFAYTSGMPREEVSCKLCDTLYPREWLSDNQKLHWDEIAKVKGVIAAEVSEEDKMDEDINNLDKVDGKNELLQGEVQRSLKELQEDLKKAETEHDFVAKLEDVEGGTHGTMCNLLLGKVNRLKTRITEAEDKEPSSTEDEARKLNRELNQIFASSKLEKARGDKWDTKVAELEKEAEEARAHARVCRANEAAYQEKIQTISQKLAQLTSGQPPPAVEIEQTADDARTAEAARLQEVQSFVDEALRNQREQMVAEFQAYLVQNPPVPKTPNSSEEAAGTSAAGSANAPLDALTKMGDDFKRKSAGLAAKAATSVVKSSITKDKGKDKKKEDARKLSGKAAEAAAESDALAARTEEQLKAVA